MTTGLMLDHAIIAVHDLHAAMQDYEQLGFTVMFGGQHADGTTHNAVIVLADGTYIELMAPTAPELLAQWDALPASSYLHLLGPEEGLVGFAFQTRDLAGTVADCRKRGLAIGDPVSGGRARPDGVRLAWEIAFIEERAFPIVITDRTLRALRVPVESADTTHPNGCTRCAQLTVAAADLAASRAFYRALLGVDEQPGVGADAAFAVGDAFRLVVTAGESSQSRPDVPVEIMLQTGSGDHAGRLDPARTHGACITLFG